MKHNSPEQSQQRTDFSEDRTVLSNERTFASWLRTGYGSAAIGLGFQALFQKMDPPWVPRAIATIFLALAIYLFLSAQQRARDVLSRLKAHRVQAFEHAHIRLMSYISAAGIAALIIAMWLLPVR